MSIALDEIYGEFQTMGSIEVKYIPEERASESATCDSLSDASGIEGSR